MSAGLSVRAVKDQRCEERREIDLDGALREQGQHRSPARILNISRHGFKAETKRKLTVGGIVWLNLLGLEPQIARVVWSDQSAAGCAFVSPLSFETFRAVLRSKIGENALLG